MGGIASVLYGALAYLLFLATFLYAGIAWAVQSAGGDRWVLVRAVILLNVGLFAVFAWQIGSIAELESRI